ncbi:MAG: hypothetical protein J4G11_09085 [Acidimicrobiia bacterium]|nr:hypothetical protein [Acidimicrobiia bacterium]
MTTDKRWAVTMKRLLKLFAFIGGIGAVGWLLQNRIVTVTMSREPREPELAPEPPANNLEFTAEARVSLGRDGTTPEPEPATADPAEETGENRPPDEE